MNASTFFRAVDDSDLDVYEARYLMRVWRRGTCWEKLESIAKTTGMSLGKASQIRRALVEKGWLEQVVADGRVAYQVTIPNVVVLHEVKPEFQEVKPEFHQVEALPINRQKEDYTIKGADPVAEPEPVKSPIQQLDDHFHAATLLFPSAANYDANWRKPLEAILHHAGGDVEKAKKLIDQAIEFSRGENRPGKPYPIMSPKSIVNIVGNLAAEQAAQKTTIDADALFEQALAVVKSGTITGADPLLARIIRAVGWPLIQQSNDRNQDEIKRRLVHEYRAAVAAAA